MLYIFWMFLQAEHDRGNVVGLNQHSGDPIDPQMEGIFDNYSVKCQIINSGYAKICFNVTPIVFCTTSPLFYSTIYRLIVETCSRLTFLSFVSRK